MDAKPAPDAAPRRPPRRRQRQRLEHIEVVSQISYLRNDVPTQAGISPKWVSLPYEIAALREAHLPAP